MPKRKASKSTTIPEKDLARVLRRIPFFEDLSFSRLRRLAKVGRTERFSRGDTIISEGEAGDTLFVLQSGYVKVEHYDSVSRRRNILAILEPGDCFGEIAATTKLKRTATIRALTDVVVFSIDGTSFNVMLRDNPQMTLTIMRSLARKLYEADRMIETLVFRTVHARTARKILELAKQFGVKESGGKTRIALTLTHYDLAEIVGANRETISRVIKDFRADGCLEYAKKTILITDMNRLLAWIH